MSTYDDDEAPVATGPDEDNDRPKRKSGAKAKAKKPVIKTKPNGKSKLVAKARKALAKKSRNIDLSKLDQFGFRLGSKKHKAAQMYASKNGATLAEVKKALKSTQFNLLTELEDKGFKIRRKMMPGHNGRQVTRFHIAT